MSFITAFFRFWYDFLVGDDWKIAASAIVTLLLTFAVARWLSHYAAGAVVLTGVLLTEAMALRRSVLGS
jgi:hypothetical protein